MKNQSNKTKMSLEVVLPRHEKMPHHVGLSLWFPLVLEHALPRNVSVSADWYAFREASLSIKALIIVKHTSSYKN